VINLVRAEVYKIRTTPTAWVLPIFTLVITAIGVVTSFVIEKPFGGGATFTAPVTVEQLRILTGAGYMAGAVMAPVLGVLVITTEFRHKGITNTLLITPRRQRVLVAKAIATAIWAVVLWVFSIALEAALGLPLMKAEGGSISALMHQVTPVIFGVLGSFVLLALFGLGLGILIKNQVGGVLVAIVATLVLEPLLVALVSGVWHVDLNWLPSRAGAAVSGGLHRQMEGDGPLLSTGLGALALLAWGIVPAVLGYFVTFRKDIT
jgi:ABC-type transport system involved in multi-copper enzyme maturation permease subunit